MFRAPARTVICQHCGRPVHVAAVKWVDLDPEVEPHLLFALCEDQRSCEQHFRTQCQPQVNPFATCFIPSRARQ